MEPSDFFILADSIFHSPPTKHAEAAERSGVSRAYYAALHTAKAFLEDEKVDFRRPRKLHEKVIGGLACSNVPALGDIADRLNKFRRLRGQADYSLGKRQRWDWEDVKDYYAAARDTLPEEWNNLEPVERGEARVNIQKKVDAEDRR